MMNPTLLLAPDLLEIMRSAAHKAVELGESVISERCIAMALLSDGAEENEALRDLLQSGQETEEDLIEDTLAFKTPDGTASVPLSRRAYATFIDGAQRAAERYTRADLTTALSTRGS